MPLSRGGKPTCRAACQRSFTPRPVRRSRAWSADGRDSISKREGRLWSRPSSLALAYSTCLQHLGTVDVDGIALYRSRDGNVMSFMSLERIRVVDHQNLLVSIRDHNHLCAGGQALLGTRLCFLVGTLGAAFVVGHPSLDGRALPHVIECQRLQSEDETYGK